MRSLSAQPLVARASMKHDVQEQPRYSPLWQLVRARLIEFAREPEAVFWVYGFPILMMIVLGIAFRNRPIEQVRVDVVSDPAGERVKTLLETGGKETKYEATIRDEDQARLRLRTGKTDLVVMPGTDNADGAPAYQLLFHPGRPESVVARKSVADLLQRAAGRVDIVKITEEPMDEPGSRYIDFLVPGLLGMSLMGGGLWGVGFVTVDMRIRKLLKRFLATPMKKRDFLASIMISRLLFIVPEVLVMLIFAWLSFGVVIRGSAVAVIVLILLGAGTFAGVGLLVASRARTLETVSGLMNLVMLPMWLLSGIFFTSDRFPAAAQPLIQLLPLTPLIDALRAVMQEGASLAAISRQLLALAAWMIVTFVLALKLFRWT